jgi:hypothetical protein
VLPASFVFNGLRFPRSGGKIADKSGMSSNSINSLASSYLQSILGTALQATGLSGKSTSSSVSGASGQSDSGQLSPFAQLMSTLQQLQQSNPAEYQQVTQQIAGNLQSAAQTATADGNTSAASQLTQLATDFTTASQSGQLPNVSDLAQAIGGGGHHHHHGHHASSSDSSTDSSSTSSTSSTTSTSSTSPLQQLLAAFESNATQNESLNPLSIITNTLASAGITATNS